MYAKRQRHGVQVFGSGKGTCYSPRRGTGSGKKWRRFRNSVSYPGKLHSTISDPEEAQDGDGEHVEVMKGGQESRLDAVGGILHDRTKTKDRRHVHCSNDCWVHPVSPRRCATHILELRRIVVGLHKQLHGLHQQVNTKRQGRRSVGDKHTQ